MVTLKSIGCYITGRTDWIKLTNNLKCNLFIMGSRMKVFDSISIVIPYRKVFNAITKENLKPNIENLSLKGPHPF